MFHVARHAFDEVALFAGEVSAEEHEASHAEVVQPLERLGQQLLDRRRRSRHERPRIAGVLSADRLMHRGKHDAAGPLGGGETDPVCGERVEPDRQVRPVELERPERKVGDRRPRQPRLDLLRAQPVEGGRGSDAHV